MPAITEINETNTSVWKAVTMNASTRAAKIATINALIPLTGIIISSTPIAARITITKIIHTNHWNVKVTQ